MTNFIQNIWHQKLLGNFKRVFICTKCFHVCTKFNAKMFSANYLFIHALIIFGFSSTVKGFPTREKVIPLHNSVIQKLVAHIEPSYVDMCTEIFEAKPVTFSQAWQDWVVFHHYIRQHDKELKWGGGIYVDIGTNEPMKISNSIFFDKCLGWKGLCVEMQSQYHEQIRQTRGCHLIPQCVMGRETFVDISGSGGLATVRGTETGTKCISIADALKEANLTHVDFLTIDIEGSEPSVLQCWDFENFSPRVITIETNKVQDLRYVDHFFHRNGYNSVDTLNNDAGSTWLDNVYVKKRKSYEYPDMKEFNCTDKLRKFTDTGNCVWPWNDGNLPNNPWACSSKNLR